MKHLLILIAFIAGLTNTNPASAEDKPLNQNTTFRTTLLEVVAYRAARGTPPESGKNWKWFLRNAKEVLQEDLNKTDKNALKAAIGKLFESLGRDNQDEPRQFFDGADRNDVKSELLDLEATLEKK